MIYKLKNDKIKKIKKLISFERNVFMFKSNLKAMSIRLANLLLVVVLISSIAVFTGCGEKESGSKASSQTTTSANSQATTKASSEASKDENLLSGKFTAVIDIKDYGKITLELDADTAPITVTNFVNLAKDGFYDGLTFHRIIDGFMMQGGDPLGTGIGGSDQEIKGEFSANGVKNDISHKRGVISMARSQAYNSASSQFFIVHKDSTFLDGQYAGFGHVTDGMDIVDKICSETPVVDNNGTVAEGKKPVINTIKITD